MKLSIPESRLSRRWMDYLDDSVKEYTTNQSGAYIIDIAGLRATGYNTARIIQEATNKFGAEQL